MNFKEATDRLMEYRSIREIAEHMGVGWHAVAAPRLDPSNQNYRSPPPGWRPKLAKLAREISGDAAEVADLLEQPE